MSLIEQVNAGIMAAMKAKEQDRLRALRGIKSAFLLLQTAEGVSEVTDDMCKSPAKNGQTAQRQH